MKLCKIPITNNKAILDVSVKFTEEVQCKALFDTGATITGVAPRIIEQAQGVYNGQVGVVGVTHTTSLRTYKLVIGIEIQGYKHNTGVSAFELRNSGDMDYDVLLGMDVIKTLQDVHIANYGKELILKIDSKTDKNT